MNRKSQPPATATSDRRGFLQQTCGAAVGLGLSGWLHETTLAADEARLAADEESEPALVRIGLVTDLHYADKPPGGSRHYRDSLAKLAAAGRQFVQAKTDVVIELGDFIDSAESLEAEKGFLRRVETEFAKVPGPRHHVLGNHCVSALTKPEFLELAGQAKSYYSFDLNHVHCIILDACFRSDGAAYERSNFQWTDSYLPPAELEWLRGDLQAATGPVLVFVHQCLDVGPPYGIKNAVETRQTLEASGRVLAVFQGHHHPGGYRQINGIHYYTLRAMVEGPGQESHAYAVVEVSANRQVRVNGFGKQPGYQGRPLAVRRAAARRASGLIAVDARGRVRQQATGDADARRPGTDARLPGVPN